jgi:hypothetical protein
MAAQLGKIYLGPSGVQLIVTKGGDADLSDGETLLLQKDSGQEFATGTVPGENQVQLGKRYKSADESVEILVSKPGACDLRCGGEPMGLKEAKALPSSD